MNPASPGVRFAIWLNETEGSDLNHQGRIRVAKKVNAIVKAEVMRERRRCARLSEMHANRFEAMVGDDGMGPSAQIRTLRAEILNGKSP